MYKYSVLSWIIWLIVLTTKYTLILQATSINLHREYILHRLAHELIQESETVIKCSRDTLTARMMSRSHPTTVCGAPNSKIQCAPVCFSHIRVGERLVFYCLLSSLHGTAARKTRTAPPEHRKKLARSPLSCTKHQRSPLGSYCWVEKKKCERVQCWIEHLDGLDYFMLILMTYFL